MEYRAISDFASAEREAQGIPLYEMARQSGYSIIAIQSFENGNRYTSIKMVQDILAVLGYRLTVEKVEGDGHKRSSPED